MSNTKIHIEFSDGVKREYTVNDEIEKKIIDGDVFMVESRHPNFGETMGVSSVWHVKWGRSEGMKEEDDR